MAVQPPPRLAGAGRETRGSVAGVRLSRSQWPFRFRWAVGQSDSRKVDLETGERVGESGSGRRSAVHVLLDDVFGHIGGILLGTRRFITFCRIV